MVLVIKNGIRTVSYLGELKEMEPSAAVLAHSTEGLGKRANSTSFQSGNVKITDHRSNLCVDAVVNIQWHMKLWGGVFQFDAALDNVNVVSCDVVHNFSGPLVPDKRNLEFSLVAGNLEIGNSKRVFAIVGIVKIFMQKWFME